MVELNWSTAADWDASQSEQRVVHENVGSHVADRVDMGFQPRDETGGSSLITYWPMDAAAGGEFQAPVGPTPTVQGTTAGTDGVLGTDARTFDGTDDQLVVSNAGWSAPYTFSAAVYPTSLSTITALGNIGATWANESGCLLQIDSGALNVSSGQSFAVGSGLFDSTRWYHVGVSFDASGYVRATVNGTVTIDTALGSPPGGFETTSYIGSEGYWNWYNGRYDELRVYDRAFTLAELQELDAHLRSGELVTSKQTPGGSGGA